MAQRGPATPLLPIRPVTVHTLSPSPYSVRMHVASLADRLTPPGSSFFPAPSLPEISGEIVGIPSPGLGAEITGPPFL